MKTNLNNIWQKRSWRNLQQNYVEQMSDLFAEHRHFKFQLLSLGERVVRGPQTHFDRTYVTGLKTHIVAASFSFPNISYMTRNASFPPIYSLDTPAYNIFP